jgi:uncharacterized membrane protein HdeD (DUF308 family)
MLRRHLATALVLAVLLGLLLGVSWSMYRVWNHFDTPMSVHGWIALVLGVVFSLIVGIGLMALMFFSSRRGYDEPPTFRRDE